MRVFLDFEASSLNRDCYPVEVGWVFEDGRGEGHLIRPAPGWVDWDPAAAAMHGLTREKLLADGEPVAGVAARLVAQLRGHELFASAPSWDGHWLSLLLRAGGFPRHLLRLGDTEQVFAEAARARLGPEASDSAVAGLVSRVRAEADRWPHAHRALADAEREWAIVRAIAG